MKKSSTSERAHSANRAAALRGARAKRLHQCDLHILSLADDVSWVIDGLHLIFNNRGNARAAKGDMEGALQDYTEAIRLKPDYARAHNNRGLARSAKGGVEGALQDHHEAIRLGYKP